MEAVRTSPVTQLLAAPRLLWLMIGLLPSAIGVGMMAVARLEYATESFGDEVGIGAVGLAMAVAGAVLAIPSGIWADRVDARRLSVLALLVLAASFMAESLAIAEQGAVAPAAVLAFSLMMGLGSALWIVTLAKVQATLVPPEARGAAELANLLRLGLGALVGTVVAQWLSPAAVLGVAAAAVAWSAVVVVLVARPVPPSPLSDDHSMRAMTGALRRIPALRGAVIVDLGLWFVLPTQLVVTMVVDRDAFEVVTYAVSAGSVGVIVGRLLLLRVGVGDKVARRLTAQMVVWVGLLALGWLALSNGWVLGQPLVIGAIVGAGSIVIGYSQGLTAALVQQRSPDDIRGRVTGLVSALRSAFTALGVVALTLVVQPGDSQRGVLLLIVLAVVMIAVVARTRSLDAA